MLVSEVLGALFPEPPTPGTTQTIIDGTFGAGVISADGIRLIPAGYPMTAMILPVGGFLTLGCLIAFSQWLTQKLAEKEAAQK